MARMTKTNTNVIQFKKKLSIDIKYLMMLNITLNLVILYFLKFS
jgi:hypothetical protein